jgi:hypothetical protein
MFGVANINIRMEEAYSCPLLTKVSSVITLLGYPLTELNERTSVGRTMLSR